MANEIIKTLGPIFRSVVEKEAQKWNEPLATFFRS
jgi:hypothetical protein